MLRINHISSVIRLKDESQNWCYKKTKHGKFFEKRTYLLPRDMHTWVYVSGDKKCLFFRKFAVLYFLVIPVLRFALFSLLPTICSNIPCKQNLVKMKNENILNLSWEICSKLRIDIKTKGQLFLFEFCVWNSCSSSFTVLALWICLSIHPPLK